MPVHAPGPVAAERIRAAASKPEAHGPRVRGAASTLAVYASKPGGSLGHRAGLAPPGGLTLPDWVSTCFLIPRDRGTRWAVDVLLTSWDQQGPITEHTPREHLDAYRAWLVAHGAREQGSVPERAELAVNAIRDLRRHAGSSFGPCYPGSETDTAKETPRRSAE